MSMLYTQQSKNITRTWLIFSLFFVVVVGLGWYVSYYYQNPNILYFFVAFSLIMNITSYWFSDKIVLSMAGAKPASRKEYFDLYTTVENLSITAGLPMPSVYVISDPAPNAFATGRDKNHSVVAVTTGLLELLEKNELEGVIAHELSHIGNKDMLLSTVVVVLVGFVVIVSDVFMRGLLWKGGSDREGGKIGSILFVVGIIFAILSPIFATLMQLAISRKREYLADATGALLTRYPEGLASALSKISSYGRPMKRQNKAISHLYISNPSPQKGIRGQSLKNSFSNLFSTHPPIKKRVEALLGSSNF